MDTDPGRLSLTVQLLIIVALTFCNAFFAMAEMALVSLSKAKLKAIADDTEDGDARAEKVLILLDEPNKFLSTIQVVITLAGFLSSAFASFNMSEGLCNLLAKAGITLNPQIAVVVITILLSYFTLVFGELFPKRIALRNPEGLAIKSVNTIVLMKKIFNPFVFLLSASVEGLIKLFKLQPDDNNTEYMEEEIINILEEGQEQGEIDETGKDMINAVFEFDDSYAYEIMTPRTDVYALCINDSPKTYIDEMLNKRYSRIPFYDEDQDDVVGVLFMKDYIIEAKEKGFDNVDIKALLKKPYFVPENKKINELLGEMQNEKQSIAIIIDEYGGFSGIITIEDLLEEIVGNIEDEFENDAPGIEVVSDNEYIVDAITNLDDLDESIGVLLESESDNSETLGGFITELSGEVPDEQDIGKVFDFKNYHFKILEVGDKRLEKIGITVDEPVSDDSQKDD